MGGCHCLHSLLESEPRPLFSYLSHTIYLSSLGSFSSGCQTVTNGGTKQDFCVSIRKNKQTTKNNLEAELCPFLWGRVDLLDLSRTPARLPVSSSDPLSITGHYAQTAFSATGSHCRVRTVRLDTILPWHFKFNSKKNFSFKQLFVSLKISCVWVQPNNSWWSWHCFRFPLCCEKSDRCSSTLHVTGTQAFSLQRSRFTC